MITYQLSDEEQIRLDFDGYQPEGGQWSLVSGIERDDEDDVYNAAIDGMESFLLALANAGMNMANGLVGFALQTAYEAIVNNI